MILWKGWMDDEQKGTVGLVEAKGHYNLSAIRHSSNLTTGCFNPCI